MRDGLADLLQKEKTPGRLVFTRNLSFFTRSGTKEEEYGSLPFEGLFPQLMFAYYN
jgi:hypothetical protein